MKRTSQIIGSGKFGIISRISKKLKDYKSDLEFTKEYIIKTFTSEKELNNSLEIYNQLKNYAHIKNKIPKYYKKINSKQIAMPSLSNEFTTYCVSFTNKNSDDFIKLKSLEIQNIFLLENFLNSFYNINDILYMNNIFFPPDCYFFIFTYKLESKSIEIDYIIGDLDKIEFDYSKNKMNEWSNYILFKGSLLQLLKSLEINEELIKKVESIFK
ncbi:MAG: hypothetical protein LAT82_00965 [Nanoarchaeota archaeon]|nr:hypothetical protein [Nanoarchaeota archaeon]